MGSPGETPELPLAEAVQCEGGGTGSVLFGELVPPWVPGLAFAGAHPGCPKHGAGCGLGFPTALGFEFSCSGRGQAWGEPCPVALISPPQHHSLERVPAPLPAGYRGKRGGKALLLLFVSANPQTEGQNSSWGHPWNKGNKETSPCTQEHPVPGTSSHPVLFPAPHTQKNSSLGVYKIH